jgi:hypothetical protein
MMFTKALKNTIKCYLIFLLFSGLFLPASPCSAEEYNLEKNIGLYKVVEAKCELTDGLFNICPEIKFIELVKGRFYDIGPDDMAFVLWRTDPEYIEAFYEASTINIKEILTK